MSAISLSQHRKLDQQPPMLWETNVTKVVERLQRRSLRRGWYLPLRFYDQIKERWSDHAGPLQPTGLALYFGRGLAYDWEQAIAWIQDEAVAHGVGFNSDYAIKPNELRAYPMRDARFDEFICSPCMMDFTGSVASDERPWVLPGIEVLWLLALNPDYLFAMDGEQVPYLTMPGLEVGSGGMPVIGRGRSGIFVYATSRNNLQAGAPARYRIS